MKTGQSPNLRYVGGEPNIKIAVLDAYIIEEIKKREDDRRRDEDSGRPRLHIDIPGWPEPETDTEVPHDPRTPDNDDDDDQDTHQIIRIDM